MKGRRAGRGFLLKPTRGRYLSNMAPAAPGAPIEPSAPSTMPLVTYEALVGSFTVGSSATAINQPPPPTPAYLTIRIPAGEGEMVSPGVLMNTAAPNDCPTILFRMRPGGVIVGNDTVPGDPFGSPLELVGLTGSITVSLQNATPDPGDPNQVEKTIWLSPPPGDGVLTVVGVSDGQEFSYKIVQGSDLTDLEELAVGQVIGGAAQPATAPTSSFGGDYRVKVGSFTPPPVTPPPDTPPPPPIVVTPGGTLFGISAGAPKAGVNPQELSQYFGLSSYNLLDYMQNEFSQLSGIPHSTGSPLMKAFHTYDTTIPSSWASSGAFKCEARNLSVVYNVKASDSSLISGAHTSDIASFCASVPSDQVIYWIVNHEPENDANRTPAAWAQGVAKFCKDVLDNRGSKKIIPGFVLQSFTWRSNNRNPEDWNPAPEMNALGVNKANVIASWDGYSHDVIGDPASEVYAAPLASYRSWGFTRIGVSETGCKSYSSTSRAGAAKWTRDMANFVKSQGFEYVMWFNSGVGQNAAGEATPPLIEGWFMYPDNQKIAWAQICSGAT